MSLLRGSSVLAAACSFLLATGAGAASFWDSFSTSGDGDIVGSGDADVTIGALGSESHAPSSFWDSFSTMDGQQPGSVAYQGPPPTRPATSIVEFKPSSNSAVPEPTGALLFLGGFAAVAAGTRRRR